jgi:hypothetical protein
MMIYLKISLNSVLLFNLNDFVDLFKLKLQLKKIN